MSYPLFILDHLAQSLPVLSSSCLHVFMGKEGEVLYEIWGGVTAADGARGRGDCGTGVQSGG